MKIRRIALLSALTLGCLGVLGTGSAVAATVWNLDLHHNQTNFAPGGTGDFWPEVANVGSTPSSGPVTLTLRLPSGLTFNSAREEESAGSDRMGWSCPVAPGASVVTCSTSVSFPRHSDDIGLAITVDVSSFAVDPRTTSAVLEGGGALARATAIERTHISADPAGFGILAESFTPDFLRADGLTPVREAGAHPDLFVVPFDFNSVDSPTLTEPFQKNEAGSVRDLIADLPPGFIGNPTAVGECSPAAFSVAHCPLSSQVGRMDIATSPLPESGRGHFMSVRHTGVFNLSHPRGVITDLAFTINNNPIHIKASLDPADHYAIRTTVSNINETAVPFNQRLTIWGVPGDHSHDSERCSVFSGLEDPGDTGAECATEATPRPFLSVPSQCESEGVMRLHHYDSWQETGNFGPEIDYPMPGKFEECERPRFEPDVRVEPTGHEANEPTGLNVRIHVAQNENPNSLATPPVKKTIVTLPEGMSFSPSFADGLTSCSLAEIKLGTNEAVACPPSSRIGEVTLRTPLLPLPAEGSMYLATQKDNPFGSLFALYLVLHDTEERGILVKIPGKIDVDQSTGQITTTFDETPQFPFEDLTLKFRSGSRAPLVNPPTCGTQRIGVKVTSWAQPDDPIDASNTYQVSEGPNGTPCPGSAATRTFTPKLTAGTLNPSAGAYSPFVFRLGRDDSEQELSRVTAVLPPGLTAKIAGLTTCPDAAIASISEAEGTGRPELEHPACPISSQLGTVEAGLGAGPSPSYFPGTVYLAGPYKGAPLSLAVVVPALAGPYDLGSSVVRTAIEVDPETARITAVSDPFPTILHGVILRIRDVRLRMDTPETTLNPTSCERSAVGGQAFGTGGAVAAISDPFQVGDCASLPFKPRLKLRVIGKTNRNSKPRLKAVLAAKPGEANISRAQVNLPHSEFLEQNHIRTVCTRVQWAKGNGNGSACPTGSVYGRARAWTPLLAHPLEGYVYLRSNGGERKLPDLVAALDGQINVALWGKVDSGPNDGIRSTFEVVPDAPVSRFVLEMNGGKKGLLVNSENLCRAPKAKRRAIVRFTGQNGKVEHFKPVVRNQCHKRKAKRGRHSHKAGRRGR